MERDFPIALQTITTHLMHHIPEGFAQFGPLYGRWLFPFKRVNSWITRQALNRNRIEATIMETYAIYDWCVYMIMSGKVKQDEIEIGKLNRLLCEDVQSEPNRTSRNKFQICDNVLEDMSSIYDFYLVSRMNKEGSEISSCTRSYGNTRRKLKFSSFANNKSSNNYIYAVNLGNSFSSESLSVPSVDRILFGAISKIFEHEWRGKTCTWVIVDIFDDVRYENGFWSVKEHSTTQTVLMLKDISAPQIVGREHNRLYFVSTAVVCK